MTSKLIDLLFGIVIQFRWKYIATLFVVFFFGSWSATDYFEPNTDITKASNYWWYFLNNVLRGGYSGYNPETTGARVVSFVSYFGGGLFLIATTCKVVAGLYEQTQLKKKGLVQLKMKRHIVLLGYRKGETESLIHELQGDHLVDKRIVLCSRTLTDNPFPGKVDFVHGDASFDEVQKRACVSEADVVVVHGHTDDRTLAIGIAANSNIRKGAHLVVYFEKQDNVRFLQKVNPAIECVTSLRTMLIAQAVFNPGATEVLRKLVSPADPGSHFRINIPLNIKPITFGEFMGVLHHKYRAIPIGYSEGYTSTSKWHLNPSHDCIIRGGMSIFYIADYRIDKIIDWNIFGERAIMCEI